MDKLAKRAMKAVGPRQAPPSLVEKGLARLQAGDALGASGFLSQAVEADPNDARALRLLGTAALHLGRPDQARHLLSRSVEIDPDSFDAYCNLGSAYMALQQPRESLGACDRALELNPDSPDAHYNTGNVHLALGDSASAVGCYRRALSLRPGWPVALINLGVALMGLGRYGDALGVLDEGIGLAPAHPKAHLNRGAALRMLGRIEEAQAAFQQAERLDPSYLGAKTNLSGLYRDIGDIAAATLYAEAAVNLDPTDPEALNARGNARLMQGDSEGALADFRTARDKAADRPDYGSNLVLATHYSSEVDGARVAREAIRWATRHTPRFQQAPPARGPIRRIGFVSGDFCEHPVGLFFEPLLNHLARRYEVVLFGNEVVQDRRTERLRAATSLWSDLTGLNAADAADVVRSEEIDVLIDLSGHTRSGRLDLFALRPAPMQFTWLGFSGTTGMSQFDGILVDRHLVPFDQENDYSEPVLRLPDSFLCAPNFADYPWEGAAPSPEGPVVFGCLNSPAKASEPYVQAVAQIVGAVPDAKLRLKNTFFGDALVASRFLALFERHGIGPERIEVVGKLARPEHWRALAAIDVALDPFPYNGATTTVECLTAGLPLVTLSGDRYSARMGASLLAAAGLSGTAVETVEDYIASAVSLGRDVAQVRTGREERRHAFLASPLHDDARFSAGFIDVLEEAWTGLATQAA
ncbi:MAG: tetratricopeptide repeat protein [Fimbriimonadaceae bacterium]|nr:MAG: tetratricopeptide repeat protein [Fimbriimonadaceae bacterium]